MHWFGMRVDVCTWWGVQVKGGGFATYRRDTETNGPDELEDGYRSCRHVVLTGCFPMTLVSGVLRLGWCRDASRRSLSAGWMMAWDDCYGGRALRRCPKLLRNAETGTSTCKCTCTHYRRACHAKLQTPRKPFLRYVRSPRFMLFSKGSASEMLPTEWRVIFGAVPRLAGFIQILRLSRRP
jgi:hypothetical protein